MSGRLGSDGVESRVVRRELATSIIRVFEVLIQTERLDSKRFWLDRWKSAVSQSFAYSAAYSSITTDGERSATSCKKDSRRKRSSSLSADNRRLVAKALASTSGSWKNKHISRCSINGEPVAHICRNLHIGEKREVRLVHVATFDFQSSRMQ